MASNELKSYIKMVNEGMELFSDELKRDNSNLSFESLMDGQININNAGNPADLIDLYCHALSAVYMDHIKDLTPKRFSSMIGDIITEIITDPHRVL